jgi:hypothetical protein
MQRWGNVSKRTPGVVYQAAAQLSSSHFHSWWLSLLGAAVQGQMLTTHCATCCADRPTALLLHEHWQWRGH